MMRLPTEIPLRLWDTEIGIKYRFIQETPDCPQAGVFPLLEVPTGDPDRDLGSGRVGAFLPLWLQKSWARKARVTAYGGGGYHINPGADNRDWVFLGLVLQRQVTESIILGGEIFHRTPTQAHDEDDTAFNLASIIDLSDCHHILLSAGRSIDGPNEFQAYAAYQLTSAHDGQPRHPNPQSGSDRRGKPRRSIFQNKYRAIVG